MICTVSAVSYTHLEEDVSKLREYIEHHCRVEGDLRRDIAYDIKRLIDIGSYRKTFSVTNARTCTVSFLKPLEVPTLNYAGCTLTFALAGNIDLVTRGEYVCLYEIAYSVSVCVSKTEFFKSFL